MNSTTIALVLLVVVTLMIASSVLFAVKKTAVRQKWSAIGIRAYPKSEQLPQNNSENGRLTLFNLKPTGSHSEAQALINKWYNFASQLTPETQGAMYALFPDLQIEQSVERYGLTSRMVGVLKIIEPKLTNPKQYKTLTDIHRTFAPDAIKIFWTEMGVKPQTGMYKNIQSYDWGTDVM